MTRQYRFGNWLFDADTHRLCDGESDLTLEPRVARLLEFLLTHPQEMLSHDCLIEAVWDGRVVSDEAVRRAMSALRHALAHDGSDRCIQTVYKKGYIASLALTVANTSTPVTLRDKNAARSDAPATACPPGLTPLPRPRDPRRHLVNLVMGSVFLLGALLIAVTLVHALLFRSPL